MGVGRGAETRLILEQSLPRSEAFLLLTTPQNPSEPRVPVR